MSLGNRIRATRIKLGLSQIKLSKATKINVMTISNYETSAKKGMRINTLLRLAAALETTTDYLLRGNRQKPVSGATGEIKKLVAICKNLPPNAIEKLIAAAKALHK